MEPRSIERGETSLSTHSGTSPKSFNGATFNRTWRGQQQRGLWTWASATLQWSHVQSNVESLTTNAARGSRLSLQWSHVQSNVERNSRHYPGNNAPGFNGATFNRTWRDESALHQLSAAGASMEPRSIERGEAASLHGHPLAEGASMEPRSIERGEECASIAPPMSASVASMEPRSIERGESVCWL